MKYAKHYAPGMLVVRELYGGCVLKHNKLAVEIVKITRPQKGELYLMPTGKRREWIIREAAENHKRHSRPILRS